MGRIPYGNCRPECPLLVLLHVLIKYTPNIVSICNLTCKHIILSIHVQLPKLNWIWVWQLQNILLDIGYGLRVQIGGSSSLEVPNSYLPIAILGYQFQKSPTPHRKQNPIHNLLKAQANIKVLLLQENEESNENQVRHLEN